ncbi:MAG: serine protease [Candidatus Paceibacterota bacterium]
MVGYLAFTNYLADNIIAFFDQYQHPTQFANTVEPEPEKSKGLLSALPTFFDNETIPDILLKSAEYQKAAVIASDVNSVYVEEPIDALVNIFCTFTTNNSIRTTTGTGFFVHSDGVIMTNAHVAQYLLLETTDLLGEADCLIRQGNPAVAEYRAELLYIPPAWVQKNASVIDAEIPTGTGERDYALLYVSESISNTPLPARFPALELDTELLPHSTKDMRVTAAGYPATDLIKNGSGTSLIPRQAETSISELYTFTSNYADVFSIRGSAVGAEGSSGGPIVNQDGKVIGMIATRGNDSVDGVGSLRAISVSHIHRTILEETGFSLSRNISGNLPYRSQVFRQTLSPFLITLLETELKN